MAGVSFDAITKRFGDVTALDAFSLDIDDGELMVLLGPSGCGKTTALRLIAGLETTTSGRLLIGDRLVNRVEAQDRDVAMVFQSYALYPHMTVARNIESPLVARPVRVDDGPDATVAAARRRLSRAERDERVRAVAARLELSDLLDRKPAELSGGQRQRVALARAIVSRPAAFLMDEPLSNLDATLRAQTRLELVELHHRLGTTMVYVTHDQVEAMTMATRIALLDQGRLQQVGVPQDVYERPANLFVARFVGSPPMNTLAARIDPDGERAAVGEAGHLRLPPSRESGPVPGPGHEVVLGVRPEHLHLSVPSDHGGDGSGAVDGPGLAATVLAVEWLGHERHVIVEIGGERAIVRESAADGPAPPVASDVRVRADAAHVHLFDPVTTERIATRHEPDRS